MKKIFTLLFLGAAIMSCEKGIEPKDEELSEMRFSPERIAEEAPTLELETFLPRKELNEKLILMLYQEKNVIEKLASNEKISYTLKKIKDKNTYILKPKKPLIGGLSYALYFFENDKYYLKHKIYIERAPANIVFANKDKSTSLIVPQNKIYFLFDFDKPIWLSDDNAVELKTPLGEALDVESMKLSPDKKRLELGIRAGQLKAKNDYCFHFNRIVNLDNRISIIEPIHFQTGDDAPKLEEVSPARVWSGAHGLEIRWQLNQDHQSEVYFGEDEHSLDCGGKFCPMNFLRKKLKKEFLSYIFIPNLKPNTKYHLMVKSRDYQGQTLFAKASVATSAPSGLTLSEVFVHPRTKPETKGEFIEYYNFSDENLLLSDIFVRLDTALSSHQCQLISADESLELGPKHYLRIVARDYEEEAHAVKKLVSFIRLKQKTLCNGLSNTLPTTITLIKGQNTILDRYAGHLWPAKIEQSIKKRDPKGLDEANNYCYSSLAQACAGL